MEFKVKSIDGKLVKSITLADDIFAVPMNEHVLHSVVKAYRANRRQGTHGTKTKANVSGGGIKPFKQKGTGQARQGSSRSPLQPGGGVSHGPQPRKYTERVPQEMKRLALRIALSDKVRHGKLLVVSDFSLSKYSTKHVSGVLNALKAPKALVSDERKDDFLYRSARNIHGVGCTAPAELNAENVLRYDSLVMTETALNALTQRFKEKASESV
jgi:large subunit ribosomal protein L4